MTSATDTPHTLDAVIFDLDGVITDTVRLHFEAWQQLTTEEGIPFSAALHDQLRGLSRQASFERILAGRTVDLATAEAWMARKNRYFRERMAALSPADILPGVNDWIAEAKRLKLKIGLGSASQNARDVLERLQLTPHFDAIGDGYSVCNIKPAPDIFLWVAGRLDVAPRRALVVEDGAAGLTAARAGGFWTVGVGDAALTAQAHLQCTTLDSLPLSQVGAMLNKT